MATRTTAPLPRSRRILAALGVLLLAALVVGGTSGPASAADGYKYWNYFHVDNGKYVFSQTGAGDYTPKDGALEAYRYGLSSSASGLPPRTAATTYTTDQICKGAKVGSGEKKVGVLIDFGTAADADKGDTPPDPRAACAVVPDDATGQQVLDAAAKVRVENALTCGIDGYPTKGCSVTVKNPPSAAPQQAVDFTLPAAATASDTSSAAQDQTQDDSGFPVALVVVVVLVVLLAGGALLLARRRRA